MYTFFSAIVVVLGGGRMSTIFCGIFDEKPFTIKICIVWWKVSFLSFNRPFWVVVGGRIGGIVVKF